MVVSGLKRKMGKTDLKRIGVLKLYLENGFLNLSINNHKEENDTFISENVSLLLHLKKPMHRNKTDDCH